MALVGLLTLLSSFQPGPAADRSLDKHLTSVFWLGWFTFFNRVDRCWATWLGARK